MIKCFFQQAANKSRWLGRVLGMAAYKFYWDDCFSRASSLSYTTVFALVPISALVFAIFGASGFNLGEKDLRLILDQLLPPTENQLLENLQQEVFSKLSLFGESVRALGDISLAVLIFTGIALLNTIESALNAVWRVSSNLGFISKIISFWAVITLGPLLLALSFYWYTKVSAQTGSEFMENLLFVKLLDFVIPVSSAWAALTLLYYKLPAARVALRDAALGAFVAAVLFEIVKRGFAYYVGLSTTYSTFYGALVTIPLFLFWVYVIWVVILFGAEISYQAGAIKILYGLRKYASELGEIGAVLGLRVLCVIGNRFIKGDTPATEGEIAVQTGSDPVLVRTCLGILADAGLITAVDPVSHSRSLALPPERISLDSIIRAFRAKRYRLPESTETNGEDIGSFIETIRSVSVSAAPETAVTDWTLRQFLSPRDLARQDHCQSA